MNGANIIGLGQRELRERHIALVPEDRMLYGIAGTASIEENVISDRCGEKRLNKGILFNMKAIHEESAKLVKDYTVLCKSAQQQVGSLSGGNIQKVVVAREFSNGPELIIDRAERMLRPMSFHHARFHHARFFHARFLYVSDETAYTGAGACPSSHTRITRARPLSTAARACRSAWISLLWPSGKVLTREPFSSS